MQKILPDDLIKHSLSFFNELPPLRKASVVCKKWNEMVQQHPIYKQQHIPDRLRRAILKGNAKVVKEILKKDPERIETLFKDYHCTQIIIRPIPSNNTGFEERNIQVLKPSLLHLLFMNFLEVKNPGNKNKIDPRKYFNVLRVLLKYNANVSYRAQTSIKATSINSINEEKAFTDLVYRLKYDPDDNVFFYYLILAKIEKTFQEKNNDLGDRLMAKILEAIDGQRSSIEKEALIQYSAQLEKGEGLTGKLSNEIKDHMLRCLSTSEFLSQSSSLCCCSII